MSDLKAAQGVIAKAPKLFVTYKNVMEFFECGKTKAYEIVDNVNACAIKKGQCPLPAGKASKYLFSELYGIPIEEVDRVISNG